MTKPFVKLALMAMAMAAAQQAVAQSVVQPARITRLAVDNQGIAFIQLSTRGPYPNQPACATQTGWDFIFPVTAAAGQALLSVALTSKMNQPQLRVIGTGTCLQNIEILTIIDILAD
jgi:hypothetical protein